MEIKEAFENANKRNKPAIIPYFTAGYPSLEASYKVFKTMADAGADIIEIGVPFSDPLADGPTIQFSSAEALSKKINTSDVLAMAKKLSANTEVPLVIMTYYNVLYGYGLEKFLKDSVRSGIKGVIIPDLPPEEACEWLNISKGKLDTIFLASPTSSLNRLKKITSSSSGFVYCVSLTGVTGSRDKISNSLRGYLKNVRKLSSLPVAVGFGISSINQAKQLKDICNGIIIGSAFIKTYRKAVNQKKALSDIGRFIKGLKRI